MKNIKYAILALFLIPSIAFGVSQTINLSAPYTWTALQTFSNASTTQFTVLGTASSSFGGGVNLTSGCFAISGTCIGGGSGTGASTTLLVDSNTFSGTNNNFTNNLGIGTSSPYAKLSVAGQVVAGYYVATSSTASAFTKLTLTPISVGTSLDIFDGSASGSIRLGADVNNSTRSSNVRKLASITAPDYGNTRNIEFISSDSDSSVRNRVHVGGREGGSTYAATELLFTTADSVSTAGGVTRMFINSAGNVGIGTTSPYAKLSVAGEVVGQNFIATSTTATSTFSKMFSGTNRVGLYVNNAGKVGVQSSATDAAQSYNFDSAAAFTVNGGFTVHYPENGSDWFSVSGGTVLFNSAGGTTRAGGYDLGARMNISAVSDSIPVLGVRGYSGGGVSDIIRVSSPSVITGDYFIVKATGKIGIGTTTPTTNLQINGTTATSTISATVVNGATRSTTLGGKIILQDMAGGTCTEITTQSGAISSRAVTCP